MAAMSAAPVAAVVGAGAWLAAGGGAVGVSAFLQPERASANAMQAKSACRGFIDLSFDGRKAEGTARHGSRSLATRQTGQLLRQLVEFLTQMSALLRRERAVELEQHRLIAFAVAFHFLRIVARPLTIRIFE